MYKIKEQYCLTLAGNEAGRKILSIFSLSNLLQPQEHNFSYWRMSTVETHFIAKTEGMSLNCNDNIYEVRKPACLQ